MMYSYIRKLIKATTTCKNAVSACLMSVFMINVFGWTRNKDAQDVISEATYTPPQDDFTETIDSSGETAVVSSGFHETVPTSADTNHAVAYDDDCQSKRRVRRKRVNSRLNTDNVLLDDEPATGNAVNISLTDLSTPILMVQEESIKINKPTDMQAVVLKTGRVISNESCTSRRNALVSRVEPKAKLVRFIVNGDRFCKSVVLAITHKRYRSFDNLLDELSNKLSENRYLPSGVRTLYSTDGLKISQLEKLEDNKVYICSSGNHFIKNMNFVALNNDKPTRHMSKLQPNNLLSSQSQQLHCICKPKIIFVVRNGAKPRKITRMLLTKRNSPSFEHVLALITESIQLDTGAVRKVYVSSGCQITKLEQFFESDDLFFAYGSERTSRDDLKLDIEEMKIVQSHRRGLRKPAIELKTGTHYTDDSGRREPELQTNVEADWDITYSMPSEILNKYTIGDRLGNGTYAVVYRCFDKLNNAEYALKVIKKFESPNMKEMIENELTILKAIKHPNIIELITELVTPTDVYLVTELINGGDLYEAIARCTVFSEYDIRWMTKNLASALSYLHGMDIVHRDVKLENLLVEFDRDGHVLFLKLADFGLSQKVDGQPLNFFCGTPMYIAPEVIIQEGYGVKIDVWSAGVTLYLLLCSFPPFTNENDNLEELFDKIRRGTYSFPEPYWDHVSEEAKDLICSMLEYDPSLRFSANDVLSHPWCNDNDT